MNGTSLAIVLSIAVLIVIGFVLILIFNKTDTKEEPSVTKLKPNIKGVRNILVIDGQASVELNQNDFALPIGFKFVVSEKEKPLPGFYILLSVTNRDAPFKIKIDDIIEEHYHRDEIILSENNEITALSHIVVLRQI